MKLILLLIIVLLTSCQYKNEAPSKIVNDISQTINTKPVSDRLHELTLNINEEINLYSDSLYIRADRFVDNAGKHILLYVISAELGESRKYPGVDTGDVLLVDGNDQNITGFKIEILEKYYKLDSDFPTIDIRISQFDSM